MLAVLLVACASPAQKLDERASRLGFAREVMEGERFRHVLYRHSAPGEVLHVYLEGDGTPMMGNVPASDPTPRRPIMLDLMGLDPMPALYLGRPCYYGLASSPPCQPSDWTSARYSEPVVASLVAVIRHVLSQGKYQGVAWFGHSGGGALAVLLAERFPQTVAVITLAANLDTVRWARYAGQDLAGSLNPAVPPRPLPVNVFQRHYAGADDTVVPLRLAQEAARSLGHPLSVVSGFRHGCCWDELWPEALKELEAALAKASGK